jgi:hypothetical protein
MAHRPGAGRDACVEGGIRESDPGRGNDGADGSRAGRLIRHVLGLYLGWFGSAGSESRHGSWGACSASCPADW